MNGLDGKVAVVTGASSGIGEATAEALSVEGAVVIVAARREDRLSDLVERIEGNGGSALAVRCDVTDESQAHNLLRRAEEEFGRVDILVNNAGVMLLSKIEKGPSDEWRRMFDVNVMGLLYTTNAAIGTMKRQGSGHIVNISSLAGRRVRPTIGVYSGTKFAVGAISEALRQELLEDNIPGDCNRAGRSRDRAPEPHHRRGGHRRTRRPARATRCPARRGHRECYRLRGDAAGVGERERDPDPPDPAALTQNWARAHWRAASTIPAARSETSSRLKTPRWRPPFTQGFFGWSWRL